MKKIYWLYLPLLWTIFDFVYVLAWNNEQLGILNILGLFTPSFYSGSAINLIFSGIFYLSFFIIIGKLIAKKFVLSFIQTILLSLILLLAVTFLSDIILFQHWKSADFAFSKDRCNSAEQIFLSTRPQEQKLLAENPKASISKLEKERADAWFTILNYCSENKIREISKHFYD